MSENTCSWSADEDGTWETECDELFQFTTDGPKENGFKFCPYCGARLETNPSAQAHQTREPT